MDMDEKQEESKNSHPVLCEECKTNPAKYKCPGCLRRSCSLPCVNAHKQRTACTGKRTLTECVSLSQFNDNIIISDYNMLEDVKRMAESARRTRVKLCGNYNFRLPFPLKSLRSAASSRRTKILFHSNGMSKREMNRTYYNNKKKFISWTLEWRFHETDIVIVDHGVHENTSLSSVIENHLKPGPWNHALRQFCDARLDSLKFFIRKYPKGMRSPFRQLNIKAPIREQLANLVILEYPVIYVFLPSHTYDFEVVIDFMPVKAEIKEPTNNEPSSPKGVTFAVEEIEESSDPHVSDLVNPESVQKIEKEMQSPLAVRAVKCAGSVSQIDNCTTAIGNNNVGRNSHTMQMDDCGDFDFELDSDLLDVYSNLIAETSIDSLLDFDMPLADEHKNLAVENFLLDLEEELEEGEIVDL